jgi:hypothetical protein
MMAIRLLSSRLIGFSGLLVGIALIQPARSAPIPTPEFCPSREAISGELQLSVLSASSLLGGERNENLAELAILYATTGRENKALPLIEQITESYWKVSARIDIAKYQPTIEAKKSLAQAIKIIRSQLSLSPYQQAVLSNKVAIEYAALGEDAKALQLVQPLSRNLNFFVYAARAKVERHKDKEAIDLVLSLPNYLTKDASYHVQLAMLGEILDQSLQDRRSGELLPHVLSVANDCMRQELASGLIEYRYSREPNLEPRFQVALKIAQGIENRQAQMGSTLKVLQQMGRYYVNQQQPEKAVFVLDQMRTIASAECSMRELLIAIAKHHIQHGSKEKAAYFLDSVAPLDKQNKRRCYTIFWATPAYFAIAPVGTE